MAVGFIGHTTLDDTVYKNGNFQFCAPGGAALYSAVAASIWLDDDVVRVISKIGSDYPEKYIVQMVAHGIDVSGIRTVNDQSIKNWLLYDDVGNRSILWQNDGAKRHRLKMTPSVNDVVCFDNGLKAVHFAPIHPRRLHKMIMQLSDLGTVISVDTHSKQLTNKESRDIFLDLLPFVDVFAPSIEEVHALVGEGKIEELVYRVLKLGPRVVAVKMGEEGSVVVDRKEQVLHYCPIYSSTDAIDVTGAGDSFCGGFLAGILRTNDIVQAQLLGTISASLLIEGFGSLHKEPEELVRIAYQRLHELRMIKDLEKNGYDTNP